MIQRTVSEYTYRIASLRDLQSRGIRLSREVTDELFRNPFIADLSETAEMCGLYSAFFVGVHHSYFVFGYDEKTIHRSRFIEYLGSVYPDEYAEKHGCYPSDGFIRTDWNSVMITDEPVEILKANRQMKVLEMVAGRYRSSGFEVLPQAFAWSEHVDDQYGHAFVDVLENRMIGSGRQRDNWVSFEHLNLQNIAAWEFPVAPDNYRKCGITAFVRSRYFPAAGRNGIDGYVRECRMDEAVHADVSKWSEGFRNNSDKVAVMLYGDEYEYVVKGLMEIHVPFLEENAQERANSRYLENLFVSAENTLSDAIGKERTEYLRRRCLGIFSKDIHVVSYLRSRFHLTRFTKDELAFGDELYLRSFDHRSSNDADAVFASYLFRLYTPYLDDFKKFAKDNDVRWGHPTDATLNSCTFYASTYLIVEAFDMPIVESFLQQVYDNEMCMHEVSYRHDAPWELRTPCKPVDGTRAVSSVSVPWHYEKGFMVPLSDMAGKTGTIPGRAMSGINWINPMRFYDDDGLHVDNAKAYRDGCLDLSQESAEKLITRYQDSHGCPSS